MSAAPYFASEPATIGHQQWRVIVTDSSFGGRRFAYQFCEIGALALWQDQTRWPAFDFGSRSMGLPRELARLYEANADAIKAALQPPAASPLAALLEFEP